VAEIRTGELHMADRTSSLLAPFTTAPLDHRRVQAAIAQ
jgi:hypothetical protein